MVVAAEMVTALVVAAAVVSLIAKRRYPASRHETIDLLDARSSKSASVRKSPVSR